MKKTVMLEQDRTSEARRKAQRNGEEDPVIVAQRFLNIYRQLHIFSAEKKEAFNKMLLELPAEIRGLFSSLPGGAVLQDYVDELSEKAGLAKAVQPTAAISAEIADEEVSKAKILATALAEAQVQAAAKIQAAPAPQPAAAPIMAAAAAPAVATTAHLSMDKGFAQEFASVLAAAMQKNNAEQKDDIKNIINTLGQTQLEIVKVLQSENNERREDMMTISKMLSDSQAKIAEMGSASGQGTQTAAVPQPKISEETKQLIRMLLDSQQQIAGRLAKVEAAAQQANSGNGQDFAKYLDQTQANFAKALNSVNERQKNDTLEIAKLINDSQQKLVQMMIQHNTLNTNSGNAAANNNNANNIQINTADYAPQLNLIVDKLASIQTANNNNLEAMVDTIVKAQSQLYREVAQAQTKELSAIISVALKESQKISTQNIIDALGSKPIVINAPLPPYLSAADSGELRATDNLVPEEEIPATPVFEEASPAFAETETPAPQKKKKKKKKKKNIEDALPEPAESVAVSWESDSDFQLPSEEKNTEFPIADFTADEPEDVAEYLPENDETFETGIFAPVEPSTTEPLPEEETADAADSDAIENDFSESDNDDEPFRPETEYDAPKSENMWLDTTENDGNDWGTFTDETPASVITDVSDDWGFGSPDKEQSDNEYQTEAPSNDEEGVEGQDWEWEYVEETPSPENVSFHSDNLQPIAAQSSICSGNLFFQKAVSNPAAVSGGEAVSAMPYPHQAIKDSAAENNRADPYKNSILQD